MAVSATGARLGERYRILRRLGSGGMATVFLAEDERLGRRVAVKRLHAGSPEEAARRFRREARVGASLNHPNIVAVYDIVADPEAVLIVMEYVDGETLREQIMRGPLAPARALEILAAVASALDYAHEHGVVHRDVGPANVLLARGGGVKLADLGIATAAENTRITRSGTVLGTVAYMAPERLDGAAGGPRADVYGLAAVAYEALSGEKAFDGRTAAEVARRAVLEPPPDLTAVLPAAPPAAATALKRALAKRPDDRPESAGALVRSLSDAFRAHSGAVAAAPASPSAAHSGQESQPAPADSPVTPDRPRAQDRAEDAAVQAEDRAQDAEPLPETPAQHPAAEPSKPLAAEGAPLQRMPVKRASDEPAKAPAADAAPPDEMPAVARAAAKNRLEAGGAALQDLPRQPPPSRARSLPRGSRRRLALAAVAVAACVAAIVVALTSSGGTSHVKRSASAPSARHASPKAGATRASGAPATGGSAASAGAPAVGGASGSATAAPGSPQQALTDFYTRGAQGDIAGAWALGTERVHAEIGGYDSFRAQESSLRSIAFPVLTLSRESGGTATVAFHSTAVHTTRTDHCTGSATLVQSGGRWLVDMLENVSCVP